MLACRFETHFASKSIDCIFRVVAERLLRNRILFWNFKFSQIAAAALILQFASIFINDMDARIAQHKSNFSSFCQILKLQQRQIFLKRCEISKIILPSNHRKNMDRDILLLLQKRRITEDLNEMNKIIESSIFKWQVVPRSEFHRLKGFERQCQQKYIRKFNWLWQKQVHLILKSNQDLRKTIKNRKDVKRYIVTEKN